jgi:NADPH-dependent ferric siderophore reductase
MTHRPTRLLLPALLAGMLPCSGGAATPGQPDAARAPDARALGLAEAYQHYCLAVDPAAARRLQARVERMTAGSSQQALAAVRSAPAYRVAAASVADFVAKVDPRNAGRPCATALSMD